MKNVLIVFVLIVISFISSYSQNIKVYTDKSPDTYFQDLIISKSGIWLFTVNGEEEYTKLIKVDKDNNIMAQSEEFPPYYDEDEARFTPRFLGVDTDDNVYFYNIEPISEIISNLYVYKMNAEGSILWKKLLSVPDYKLVLSKGFIINDKLICLGGAYNLENEAYIASIFSLSINDGTLLKEKSISAYPVNAFFDAQIIDDNSFVALLIGYNDISYFTKIYEFNDSLEELNKYDLVKSDYFSNRIAVLNQNDYIISGFGEDGVSIIKYNKKSKSIVWEQNIGDGWDDLDIPVLVENNKIFTLHTAFPHDTDPSFPGSEVEIAVHSFAENGDLIDTLFIDHNAKNMSNLSNAVKGNDGKIYFCGNFDDLSLFETNGIWGYFDLSLLSSLQDFEPILSVNLYPNILDNNETIHFESEENLDKIKIYDTKGNLINNCEFSNTLKIIELPQLNAGVYFLEFKSQNSKYITKLIVN